MDKRTFGKTGYEVSVLGFGAGHIGRDSQDEQAVGRMLNEILDLEINFIDTARAYGNSEERIGKFLSHRRREFILSSKGGYSSKAHPDWTYDSVRDSIHESLIRMKTDFIDIYHLHSCTLDVLQRGDVIDALERAKEDGKIGVVAYSGENDALDFALDSGRFGSIQCSVNICDQHSIDHQIRKADSLELGIIGKRPIANAPWRFDSPPLGHYSAEYWYRFREMHMQNFGMDWNELAIRFSAYTPGVSTVITGTSSKDHLLQNLKSVEKGPLPEEIINHLKEEFRMNDKDWKGLV